MWDAWLVKRLRTDGMEAEEGSDRKLCFSENYDGVIML